MAAKKATKTAVKKAAPKKAAIKAVKKAEPKKAVPKKAAAAPKKAAKKAVKKAAPKKAAPKKAAKTVVKKKRKLNPALKKPVQPDEALAAVVGGKPIPRSEITKKIWDYIKKNGLQDQQNKRMINADATLKTLFGGKKKVSMFEMTKLVSGHIKG